MQHAPPGVGELVSRLEDLASGKAPIMVFEAPTGYGKTRSGPLLYRGARSLGVPRLIHALPLRAIVEEAYLHYSSSLPGAPVGYQAHGLGLHGKAPFYAPRAVVTTMDSFAINFFRNSVGERGLGHYEVPRAHIITSLIVFDEAHIPLEDANTYVALASMVSALLYLRVPVVLETATLPQEAVERILSLAGARGKAVWLRVAETGASERGGVVVEDEDYVGWASSIKWDYSALASLEEAAEASVNDALSGKRVFFAATRVADAVAAYKRIVEKVDGAVLVHGRLTVRDRIEVSKKASSSTVVVGTRAVEAGVNIDADIVYTDLPLLETSEGEVVNWPSIIQRLGRACRSRGRGCGRVGVYIYGQGAPGAVGRLKGVNPRLPSTYRPLIEETYRYTAPTLSSRLYRELERIALGHPTHERIRVVHEFLCGSPFRGKQLLPVILVDEPSVEEAIRALEQGDYYLIDNSYVEAAYRRGWLHKSGEGAIHVLLQRYGEGYGHPSDSEYRVAEERVESVASCRRLLQSGIAGVLGVWDRYEEGVGPR